MEQEKSNQSVTKYGIAKDTTLTAKDVSTLLDESKPEPLYNCLLMAAPFALTVISTMCTGLPLAIVVVVPGATAGLVHWITSSSPAARQMWRSLFIGCFAGWFFLGFLASQW